MLMNPAHVPGETVGKLYNRMVAYARTLDPRFVGGAASVPEMDRVKKAIETLERQAAEKARPFDREGAELSGLSRRFDEARSKVAWLQAELKARVSPELTILVTPEDWEAPAPISEYEASIAVLTPRVASLEAMGQRLNSYLVEWPRLSVEQQNRKLILALAERMK
jgi:uncharacterized coiled-coil protein SlyX